MSNNISSPSTIELYEVISHIDSGRPFNMTYVTADKKKGTGGQIKVVKNWVRCDLAAMPEIILRRNKVDKMPRHQEHKTKNIMNPATRDIKKVHIRLICEFNGRRVV